MALLSDVPKVIRETGLIGFGKRVGEEVMEDNLFTLASALAYSWLFAIFPFLIFLMTLLPYLPEDTRLAARQEMKEAVYDVFPKAAADTVWRNTSRTVDKLLHQKEGKLLPRLIGLALALWAASSGMATTMTALDLCYEVHKGRPFYVQRPLALGMTFVVATLLLIAACLVPVGSVVKMWVENRHPRLAGTTTFMVFDVLRWAVAVACLVGALSVLYHKGPSIKRKWVWLTPGGLFCLTVWVALGVAFNFYVTRFGTFGDTYGHVGGVVVLLLFFYVDAVVLLIGAEIDSEIDFKVLGVARGERDYRAAEAARRAEKTVVGVLVPATVAPKKAA